MTTRKPVRWYVESWAKHSTRWYAKRGPFKARALAVASRVRLRAEEPDKRHIITRSPKHVPDGTPSQAAEVRRLRGEVNRLRRALTFYANENAYAYQGDIHLMGSVIAERGNIARVTLAGGDPMGNADRSLRRAKAKDAALRGRRGR